MTFVVDMPRYQGPYEALLELIDKRKLSITEISVQGLIEDYITYIEKEDYVSLDTMSRFLSVASTLLLIKIQSLIPQEERAPEVRQEISTLETHIRIAALRKKAESHMRECGEESVYLSRLMPRPRAKRERAFLPGTYVQATFIRAIGILTVRYFKEREKMLHITLHGHVPLHELEDTIRERMRLVSSIKVHDALDTRSRGHLIGSFLALLSLIGSGEFHLDDNHVLHTSHTS